MCTQRLAGHSAQRKGAGCACVSWNTHLSPISLVISLVISHFFHEPAEINGHHQLTKELQLPAWVLSPSPLRAQCPRLLLTPGKRTGSSRSVKADFTSQARLSWRPGALEAPPASITQGLAKPALPAGMPLPAARAQKHRAAQSSGGSTPRKQPRIGNASQLSSSGMQNSTSLPERAHLFACLL